MRSQEKVRFPPAIPLKCIYISSKRWESWRHLGPATSLGYRAEVGGRIEEGRDRRQRNRRRGREREREE